MVAVTTGVYSKVTIPNRPLTPYSLNICAKDAKVSHLTQITDHFIDEMYEITCKIISFWKKKRISTSYMVLGIDHFKKTQNLSFQLVP